MLHNRLLLVFTGGISVNITIRKAILVFILIFFMQFYYISTSAAGYTDIDGNWAEDQINDLISLNIIDGYDDLTIKPDNLITRAEFANILVKALDLEDTAVSGRYFIDVLPSQWYYKPITILKQLSIIDGYDNKNFKPNTNISRIEMITAIVKACDNNLRMINNTKDFKDVKVTYWGYNFVNIAQRAGIIANNGNLLKPDEFVTRAEISYSVDKMLWSKKNSGLINIQELYKILNNYTDILNLKYVTKDSNVDDLKEMSYGGQLNTLTMISKKNALYNKLNANVERDIELSHARLSSTAYNLIKVTFNYNLTSKTIIGSTVNSNNENGILTYFIKRLDNKWLVYNQTEEVIKPAAGEVIGKLNLVWDYVSRPVDYFKGGKIDGLDVVSPTWFNICDGNGNFENRASIKYVDNAHELGYQVWGLVSNDFNPAITSDVLNNDSIRQKVVNKIVEYADYYNLDGINIDFENMYKSDRDIFTKFIEELRFRLKAKGVILSVDVTVISPNSSWSTCYDREKLAKVSDYIAVMTYDQHWSTDTESGSVAQLVWVENGVKNILNEVTNDKLLLGLPFYTREWKEMVTDNGITVESEALSMAEANRRIALYGANKTWDSESGQYYVQYNKEGATCKIWLEDSISIDLKSKLVSKYNLGGTAAWKAGLETKDIWGVLKVNLGK